MYHATRLVEPPIVIQPPSSMGGQEPLDAALSTIEGFADALGAKGATLALSEPGQGYLVLAEAGDCGTTSLPFMLSERTADVERSGMQRLTVDVPLGNGATLRFCGAFAANTVVETALVEKIAQVFARSFDRQWFVLMRLASYEAALERSEVGVVLLSGDGSLLFVNRAADQLLSAREYLRRKGDGIAAMDFGDALKLQVAIEHVCDLSGAHVDDPVVAIKRNHPLRPLLVHVSSAARTRSNCDVGAILRIIDPDRDLQASIEPVCGHYRLSPVETRLACALARGVTLDSAAAALRIKLQTARSYLKQIFLKTDTNRQSELVRLLLLSTVRTRPQGRFRVV